jgi:hypothetical protein
MPSAAPARYSSHSRASVTFGRRSSLWIQAQVRLGPPIRWHVRGTGEQQQLQGLVVEPFGQRQLSPAWRARVR